MPVVQRASRALPRSIAALGAALLLLASDAGTARAAGASVYADGLHLATGALVDPNGRTWVSDHNAGFCRVTDPTDTSAGTIEHPQTPDAPGARTCLGGLLPDAGLGPDAAGQPALFDPSPEFPDSGDELAFIPDGASASADVVRASWNPDTGLFEFKDTVTMQGDDRGRPTAVSLGPDDNLYVTFQREDSIQRMVDIAGAAPFAEIVGTPADGRAPAAIAAGRDAAGALAVYVVEGTGLRVLRPSPSRPATEPVPFDVPGATGIGSLSYDLADDVLWAGTADAALPADIGMDDLIRVDVATGGVEREHATGFTAISGVNVRPDGHVIVVDDPGLVDGEPLGTGRMFHVGLPTAHVTSGPTFTNDPSPEFQVGGEGTVQCLLRGPGLDTEWEDCPEGGLFQVGQTLPDERYTLSVRSVADGVTGLPQAHGFTVDTLAPVRPVVVRPADAGTVSGVPWYEFDAELHASAACRFDAETEFTACAPGRTRSFSEAGQHTLQITATDRAGNVSEPSAPVTFTVDPDLPPATPPGWSTGPITHRGSSLYGAGLHVPAGAIVDPNGRLWVSDHNAGFCRVSLPGDDGPGTIEHPQVPGAGGPHTCMGGLLPEALPGADAAGQPSFVDPTPAQPGSGDEVVLVPDGASPSSEVYRATWNPDSGLFEPKDAVTLINNGKGTRPTATSLGPDGAVYVGQKRDGNIQRISNPAGNSPVARIVGFTADGEGTESLAAGRDADGRLTVWIAEKERFAELSPNAVTPPNSRASQVVLPVPAGLGEPLTGIGSMVYDLDRDELWIGTANASLPEDAGTDVVHKLDTRTGVLEANYATGYTIAAGLGLRPDGVLYVTDDPALLDPAEPLGYGRVHQIGMPAARITRGPILDDGTEAPHRASTADTTPSFEVEGDEVTQCRLRGGELDTGWSACPADGVFTPAAPLAEGDYALTVRAVDGEQVGLVELHRFAVDLTAPERPLITSPGSDALVGATPWFAFASEPAATYLCRWNAETEYAPCEPGRTRAFTENGRHTLQIRAIDRAGNVSVPSEPVTFDARGTVTAVRIDSGPQGRTSDNAPTFRFSADALDVEYGCRLVGAGGFGWQTCNTPKAIEGLHEGDYTFEVRGRDAAGNVSPITQRSFTVDQTGPVTSLSAPAERVTAGSAVTIRLAANEGATWRCRVNGLPFEACGSTQTFTGLDVGEHTVQAVGTDDLGNVGAVATHRFTVAAPAAPAPTPAPAPVAVDPQADEAGDGGDSAGVSETLALRDPAVRVGTIDRRRTAADLREAGFRVSVRSPRSARVIRLRIHRLAEDGASQRRQHVATVYRKARRGETVITLSRRHERKLEPGRYAVQLRAGKSRNRLGRAVTRRFTITG